MKKVLCLLITLSLTLGIMTITATADTGVTVLLNGEVMEFEVPAQIIDNRTMVPMRAIFEALDADVEWIAEFRMILATTYWGTISMMIDYPSMLITEGFDIEYQIATVVELDVPPQIVDNRTLVPIRAISESLGATVDWYENTQTVTISTL